MTVVVVVIRGADEALVSVRGFVALTVLVRSFACVVFTTICVLSAEAAGIAETAVIVGSMSTVIVKVVVEVDTGTVTKIVVEMVGVIVITWGETASVTASVSVDVIVEV